VRARIERTGPGLAPLMRPGPLDLNDYFDAFYPVKARIVLPRPLFIWIWGRRGARAEFFDMNVDHIRKVDENFESAVQIALQGTRAA